MPQEPCEVDWCIALGTEGVALKRCPPHHQHGRNLRPRSLNRVERQLADRESRWTEPRPFPSMPWDEESA